MASTHPDPSIHRVPGTSGEHYIIKVNGQKVAEFSRRQLLVALKIEPDSAEDWDASSHLEALGIDAEAAAPRVSYEALLPGDVAYLLTASPNRVDEMIDRPGEVGRRLNIITRRCSGLERVLLDCINREEGPPLEVVLRLKRADHQVHVQW